MVVRQLVSILLFGLWTALTIKIENLAAAPSPQTIYHLSQVKLY